MTSPLTPTRPRRKRAKRTYDEAEFSRGILRNVKHLVKRGANGGGIDSLVELVRVREETETAIADLVRHLRTEAGGSYSWNDVAQVLGITRGRAQQKYGGEGARTTGGQPWNLR